MNIARNAKTTLAAAFMIVAAILGMAVATVFAEVEPPLVEATVPPGGSLEVVKEVTTPAIPPKLDFCLLVDNSGSYGDDIATIQALAPGIFTDIRDAVADSQFCLATFVDFPIDPFGDAGSGDYPYQLDQDLTTDETTWVTAVNNMILRFGADAPESQLHALREMRVGGPAAPSWRADATKVIAITTDAPMHDPDTTPGYPGPTIGDTITALVDSGIKVIAIKAPGASTQMDDIATATGGSVQTTSASSDEIADAIIAGLEALTTDVWWVLGACDAGLTVSLDPAVHLGVAGNTTVVFTETIMVDDDSSLEGTTLVCEVIFIANTYPEEGAEIGRQRIVINVPDVTPPVADCMETVNPHGSTVPPAGSTTMPGPKGGQNEDGFYELLAKDNLDPNPEIWVMSSGPSGATFGPFASGDKVKVTEAPGATPTMKSMGSDNGQAGAIAAHLILDGDAMVFAVDASGNVSALVACHVPPPPK
ncbi:MAG: VWA domain-containing protein [Chloroflexi bacterium]|nr:VWA domain-containing protein [Chloroflexota bacterium]